MVVSIVYWLERLLPCLVHAGAGTTQGFALCFDLDRFIGGCETKAAGHTIPKNAHVLVFKLENFRAVHADQVIVIRAVNKVGIIGGDSLAQVDFMKQPAIDEKHQGPVARRT